jgi:hypothetical protein
MVIADSGHSNVVEASWFEMNRCMAGHAHDVTRVMPDIGQASFRHLVVEFVCRVDEVDSIDVKVSGQQTPRFELLNL